MLAALILLAATLFIFPFISLNYFRIGSDWWRLKGHPQLSIVYLSTGRKYALIPESLGSEHQ